MSAPALAPPPVRLLGRPDPEVYYREYVDRLAHGHAQPERHWRQVRDTLLGARRDLMDRLAAIEPDQDGTWNAFHAREVLASVQQQLAGVEDHLARYLASATTAAWDAGATAMGDALAAASGDKRYRVTAPDSQAFVLTTHQPQYVKGLTQRGLEGLTSVLNRGQLKGDSSHVIMGRMRQYLDVPERPTKRFGGLAYQAYRLFVTETGRAFDLAAEQSSSHVMTEVGGDDWLTVWLHSGGGQEPRPNHVALHGTSVRTGERFQVAPGITARFPHDPDLPVGQVAFCRCTSMKWRQSWGPIPVDFPPGSDADRHRGAFAPQPAQPAATPEPVPAPVLVSTPPQPEPPTPQVPPPPPGHAPEFDGVYNDELYAERERLLQQAQWLRAVEDDATMVQRLADRLGDELAARGYNLETMEGPGAHYDALPSIMGRSGPQRERATEIRRSILARLDMVVARKTRQAITGASDLDAEEIAGVRDVIAGERRATWWEKHEGDDPEALLYQVYQREIYGYKREVGWAAAGSTRRSNQRTLEAPDRPPWLAALLREVEVDDIRARLGRLEEALAVLIEDRLLEAEQPRVPAGSSRGGQFASTGGAVASLQEKWQGRGVDVWIHERDLGGERVIVLDSVKVPKERRGKGEGTAFMRELVELADRRNQMVALTPATEHRAALRRWYASFGFVRNVGRRSDLRVSETMIRQPGAKVREHPGHPDQKVHGRRRAAAGPVPGREFWTGAQLGDFFGPRTDRGSQDERFALAVYKGAGYREINTFLRHGAAGLADAGFYSREHAEQAAREFVQPNVDGMDSLFAKQPPLDEAITVYRSGRIPTLPSSGTFRDRGFVSTSILESVADRFSSEGEVIMKITVPAGSRVVAPAVVFSGRDSESEVVLNRGSRFRYLGVDPDGVAQVEVVQ